MKTTRFIAFILLTLLVISPVAMAQGINNPILPVNQPEVIAVGSTSATVSVPTFMLDSFSAEQKAGVYFEYIPSQQVCIMIYPTPESCLPKKTTLGKTTVTLTGLKPSTSYTVNYKKDNTIACITTPCPENGLQSGSVEFTTNTDGAVSSTVFTRNLMYRSRGAQVTALQDILRAQGYMTAPSSGFFGIATVRGVKAFQKNYMHIAPTGFVGARTRVVLNTITTPTNVAEYFSGTIQSVSTACYADGVCSVTIDGKKVVTTVGWSQAIVGSIKGAVNNIGDIETSKIGTRANVYAQKTADGYTLYGDARYYIEVL